MRAVVIWAVFLLTTAVPLAHSQNSPGEVSPTEETTRGGLVWAGDLYISENVTVPVNETLKIMPGTNISFGSGVRVLVRGSLQAEGRVEAPITMRAQGHQWDGLFISGGRAHISHLRVDGAIYGLAANASQVVVRNSTFHNYTVLISASSYSNVVWVNSTISQSAILVDLTSSVSVRYHFQIRVIDRLYGPLPACQVNLTPSGGGEAFSVETDCSGTTPLLEVEGALWSGNPIPMTGSYTVEVRVLGRLLWSKNYVPFTEGNLLRSLLIHVPPTLLNFSREVEVDEDIPTLLHLHFYTPGEAEPHFQVTTSSPLVSYVQEPPSLMIFAPEPHLLSGAVNLSIYDGLSWGNYTLQITVRERNDPPVISLPFKTLVVKPGEVLAIVVYLEDEESPEEDLLVTTSQPWAHFSRESSSLVVEVPGDVEPTLLYLNVTDYFSVTSSSLLVTPQPIYSIPESPGDLPEVVLNEEGRVRLNMSAYFGPGSSFRVVGEMGGIVKAWIEGGSLVVEGLKDAWGEGEIYLMVTGDGGGEALYTLNVTVNPLSDPPELLNPDVHTSRGSYTFEVLYRDRDGDPPLALTLVLNGEEYPLEVPNLFLDYYRGVRFSISLTLPPGNFTYYFKTLDRWGRENETEVLQVPVGEGRWGEGIWEGGILRARYLARGEGSIASSLNTSPPPAHRVASLAFLNVTIHLEVQGILKVEELHLFVDLPGVLPAGVLPSTVIPCIFTPEGARFLHSSYSSTQETLEVILQSPLPDMIYLFSFPAPGYDSDGDGIPDLQDRYPSDSAEWRDSDSDGVGDGEDSDDDNDGYTDDVELACGTDPLSAKSVPQDTDGDGAVDFIDEDSDGDGIADEWEEMRGLDPLDPSDAGEDSDGDGLTNLEEYRRGEPPWSGGAGGSGKDWLSVVLYATAAVLGVLTFYLEWRKRNPR